MISFGEIVDNQRICDEFEVANTGGIRVNRSANLIVLIAANGASRYGNQWEGDVLHFAGSGAKQSPYKLERQNKTLARSVEAGADLYLFTRIAKGAYRYDGVMQLVAPPKCIERLGIGNDFGFIWMFPLRRISERSAGSLTENAAQDINARRLNDWQRSVCSKAISRTKALIRRMKERARKRNRSFGFTDDEVNLDGADETRLCEVLEIVGCADQFQDIMESARSEVPVPDMIGTNTILGEVPELTAVTRDAKRLDPTKLKGWS